MYTYFSKLYIQTLYVIIDVKVKINLHKLIKTLFRMIDLFNGKFFKSKINHLHHFICVCIYSDFQSSTIQKSNKEAE